MKEQSMDTIFPNTRLIEAGTGLEYTITITATTDDMELKANSKRHKLEDRSDASSSDSPNVEDARHDERSWTGYVSAGDRVVRITATVL
jgi:hypothetical protein